MKSLTALSRLILEDLGDRCDVCTTRDFDTIARRVEHEGISFLTISLPAFARDFEQSLELGHVGSNAFVSFSRKQGLPRFLGGFLSKVFDSQTGVLLDDPHKESIRAIRQIALMFGKIELPCADHRVKAAYDKYIECELEVEKATAFLESNPHMLADFSSASTRLFGDDLFLPLEARLRTGTFIVPRHSSGSTADRLRGNAKYTNRLWYTRFEEFFSLDSYGIPNWGHWERLQEFDLHEPGDELPVKVTDVPKTLKTPRIIAMEPTVVMYLQQALHTAFIDELSQVDYLRKSMSWEDQEPNRVLSYSSSITKSHATLDLSEASDRVSNLLVQSLLKNYPHLSGAVQSVRSTRADVNGEILNLSKFASMGSALCFPMETFVFATLIVLAKEQSLGRRLTMKEIKSFMSTVRVYGDDLIVPVDIVKNVVEVIEAFGLKVNSNKSFWTGQFRESCGGDYYDGQDVTPVRVRRIFPTRRSHAEELVSTVSLRNQLYKQHYPKTVQWLDELLERILRIFPTVPDNSPILGKHTFDSDYTIESMCEDLHVPLIKGYTMVSSPPVSVIDDVAALMKTLLPGRERPFRDPEHLLRGGRPVAYRIIQREVPLRFIEEDLA